MQVPAQPLMHAAALVDDRVAMIDQQLQLAIGLLVRTRTTRARFAESGACNSQRVDRVRLAARPAMPTLRRHQLRRHAHQLLTGREQLMFKPAGQPPAILERPQPLLGKAVGPGQQLDAANRDRLLGDHAARVVRGDRRHRLLVHVHSDHDHSSRLQAVGGDRRADRPHSRPKGHAPIRSRSTVSVGGGDTTLASQPSGDIRNVSQPAPTESLPTIGRHHHGDNDSEFRNELLTRCRQQALIGRKLRVWQSHPLPSRWGPAIGGDSPGV
jgi:hypothetical protein